MSPELDAQLVKKYPKIFADRYKDMTQTAMCWGFDCGDGWFTLLDTLCDNIQWHIDSAEKQKVMFDTLNNIRENALAGNWEPFNEYYPSHKYDEMVIERQKSHILSEPPVIIEGIEQVVADQVKEKFGTLRFYYSGGDDKIDGMVTMAESMSAVTCEVCGNSGKLRKGNWLRTLCDMHATDKGQVDVVQYETENE